MKKAVSVFVLFLLLLSIFSLAEEADTSADTETQPISEPQTISKANSCGFWCKINTFLFGSAENRAGMGWFDRKGALVAN